MRHYSLGSLPYFLGEFAEMFQGKVSSRLIILLALVLATSACTPPKRGSRSAAQQTSPIEETGGGGLSDGKPDPEVTHPPIDPGSCPVLTGTKWTPSPSIGNLAAHAPSAASGVVTEVYTIPNAGLTGLGSKSTAIKEVAVSIPMPSDLGPGGSISLVADVTDFPSDLEGGAFPMLISLNDGVSEWLNIDRAACASGGYFSCPAGQSCSSNLSCRPKWPSAYHERNDWEEHQISTFGRSSVNTFPNCNWNAGTGDETTTQNPGCAFRLPTSTKPGFLYSPTTGAVPRLRFGSGVTYTAKYVLIADRYATVNARSVTLRVRVQKKTDTGPAPGPTVSTFSSKAVDLNLVIVGTENIRASRTAKGKQNLDALVTAFQNFYGGGVGSGAGIKVGKINAIEWNCEQGGDYYAAPMVLEDPNNPDPKNDEIDTFGNMIAEGSTAIQAVNPTPALNVFLVNSIDLQGSSLQAVGFSAAKGGPLVNGMKTSGLAFSTLGKLDQFNPRCTSTSCGKDLQERDFVNFSFAMAHEVGHFLGLSHPSERDGYKTGVEGVHDFVYDTPKCTTQGSVGGVTAITASSCMSSGETFKLAGGQTCNQVCSNRNPGTGIFCETRPECQFNHLMWWLTKDFNETTGKGDGSLISPNSASVIRYSPAVF